MGLLEQGLFGVMEGGILMIGVECVQLYGGRNVQRKSRLEEKWINESWNPQENLSNGMLMLLDYSRLP